MQFRSAFSVRAALEAGWRIVRAAPLPILIAALAVIVTDWRFGLRWSHFDWQNLDRLDSFEVLRWLLLFVGFFGILKFLFRCFVLPSYLTMADEIRSGRPVVFDSLFAGADRFLDMLQWQLLRVAILGALATVLLGSGLLLMDSLESAISRPAGVLGLMVFASMLVLPALVYAYLGLFFGEYLVALEEHGPLEALRESWRAARGVRLSLLSFLVATTLFWISGLALLGVGVVFTRATVQMGTVNAFRDWREQRVA